MRTGKLILNLVFVFFFNNTNIAQNVKKMNDYERISFGVFIDEKRMEEIPRDIISMLENKLANNISSNGLGSSNTSRFFLTAKSNILSKEAVQSSSALITVKIELHIFAADNVEKKVFGSTFLTLTGVGETEKSAYRNAIKDLSNRELKISELLNISKEQIVEFYSKNCDFILADADENIKTSNYDEAIYKLEAVPSVCEECYFKVKSKLATAYNLMINYNCERYLKDAKVKWSANQTKQGANDVSIILNKIEPNANCYNEVLELVKEIQNKVKEINNEEFQFKKQQQQDQLELEKQRLENIRQISLEYYKSRPREVYTTYYIWR